MEWRRQVFDSNIGFRLNDNGKIEIGDRMTDSIVMTTDLKRTPAVYKSQQTLKNDEFQMLFGPFTELISI